MPSVAIDTNSGSDVELVAAPGARQFIRVLHWHLSGAAATARLYSGSSASGTLKDGATLVAGTPITTPEAQMGLFDCAVGEALTLKLASGAAVLGMVRYEILGPSV